MFIVADLVSLNVIYGIYYFMSLTKILFLN